MDKDIDTYESLSTSFEVQGFGVPKPKAIWYDCLPIFENFNLRSIHF